MRELFTVFLLIGFSSVQAQGILHHYHQQFSPHNDARAFLYLKKDFGSYSYAQDTSVKFGFTVDYEYNNLNYLRNNLSRSSHHGHTVLALEYSTGNREFSRFKLGALDKSDLDYILRQNSENGESSSGLTSQQWLAIGIGVVAVGVLVYVLTQDSCDTNAPTFQPQFCPAE